MIMSDVNAMRTRLRELVEDGDVLEAVKEVGRYHGFSKFPIDNSTRSFGVGILALTYLGPPYMEFEIIPRTLHLGSEKMDKLKMSARNDVKLAEHDIEKGVLHEAGHERKPKKPVKIEGKTVVNAEGKVVPYHGNGKIVPYSLDEIMNSQFRKGIDPQSRKAEIQQDSQANLYAAVKYNEDRTLEELIDGIATSIWCNSIYTAWGDLEKEVPKDELIFQSQVYAQLAGYDLWLKPAALDKIKNKVVKIDKDYRSKLAEAEQ